MIKLRHKATNKVYDWDGIAHFGRLPFGPNPWVTVRTNCEAYPEECYDFDEAETSHDGHTQYYVEEPLADFEIIN